MSVAGEGGEKATESWEVGEMNGAETGSGRAMNSRFSRTW